MSLGQFDERLWLREKCIASTTPTQCAGHGQVGTPSIARSRTIKRCMKYLAVSFGFGVQMFISIDVIGRRNASSAIGMKEEPHAVCLHSSKKYQSSSSLPRASRGNANSRRPRPITPSPTIATATAVQHSSAKRAQIASSGTHGSHLARVVRVMMPRAIATATTPKAIHSGKPPSSSSSVAWPSTWVLPELVVSR